MQCVHDDIGTMTKARKFKEILCRGGRRKNKKNILKSSTITFAKQRFKELAIFWGKMLQKTDYWYKHTFMYVYVINIHHKADQGFTRIVSFHGKNSRLLT